MNIADFKLMVYNELFDFGDVNFYDKDYVLTVELKFYDGRACKNYVSYEQISSIKVPEVLIESVVNKILGR